MRVRSEGGTAKDPTRSLCVCVIVVQILHVQLLDSCMPPPFWPLQEKVAAELDLMRLRMHFSPHGRTGSCGQTGAVSLGMYMPCCLLMSTLIICKAVRQKSETITLAVHMIAATKQRHFSIACMCYCTERIRIST